MSSKRLPYYIGKLPCIPPSHKWPVLTNQLKFMYYAVLGAMLKDPNSLPFREPLYAIEPEVPECCAIIRDPMDLTTIQKRLENFWYSSSRQCQDDFRKIFRNCYVFNSPGSLIVSVAKELEELYYAKMSLMPGPEAEIPLHPLEDCGL